MTEFNIERLQNQRFGNGRYTLGEPAASKTNMSIVYKARDNNTGQTVAIKLLLPEHARNEPIRLRFELEAKVSYGLQHPNIAATIDYSLREENGIPAYLVMKWLPGDSLDNRIKSGFYQEMPPQALLREAAALLEKVGGALDFIHQNKIVHRDIKPSNILIYNDEPYIVDFGIAKRIVEDGATMVDGGGLTQGANTAPGTPRYIAPETVLFMPVDGRTDQYSMALVIYEMLTGTGTSPYTRSSGNTGWQEMHLRQDPTPLTQLRPDLPSAVWEVLQRALIKKPELRYATMKEFSDAFNRAVGVKKAATATAGAARGGAGRRMVYALGALAAVGVLGAGILIGSGTFPVGNNATATPAAVVVNVTEVPTTQPAVIIRTHTPTHTATLSNDEIVATALAQTQSAQAAITQAFETQVAVQIAAETAAAQTLAAQATATFTASPTDTATATATATNTASPSPTATHTATVTPSPTATQTPIGGGSGTFLFTRKDTNGKGDIIQRSIATREENQLTNNPADDIEAVWSPDLKQIAFSSNRNNEIYNIFVMNADGSSVRRITDFARGVGAYRPSWSADGNTIFFHYINEAKYANIYSYNLKNNRLTRLTYLQFQVRRPVVSPDGKSIIVFSNHEGSDQLYKMPITGRTLDKVLDDDVHNAFGLQSYARPQISPDGNSIAFYGKVDGGSGDIYVMDFTGDQLRRLTDSIGEEDLPVWSPDSQKIAFSSRSGNVYRVFTIAATGFGLELFFEENTFIEVTDWR